MTWSVTDTVPPELFPEYEQTVANDTPVIVNEAVLKSPLSRPGIKFTEEQKRAIKKFLAFDDTAIPLWAVDVEVADAWEWQQSVCAVEGCEVTIGKADR